ncbi:hypothetical protein Tcan_14552 [Toxocara canis]|uniref:Uncharacterized protein n=1 Tax=Toxocara canis TaxID=6265 RepID=A0A0B2USQ8_TOXCA|nr:hypothetical protein Tcan_14552 [Toxocara canis]
MPYRFPAVLLVKIYSKVDVEYHRSERPSSYAGIGQKWKPIAAGMTVSRDDSKRLQMSEV